MIDVVPRYKSGLFANGFALREQMVMRGLVSLASMCGVADC